MKAFLSMVLLLSLGMLSSVGAETKSSLRSNDKQGRLEQGEEKGTGSTKSKRQLYVKHTPQAAAYSYTVVGSVQQDPKQTKEDPVEAARYQTTPALVDNNDLLDGDGDGDFLDGDGDGDFLDGDGDGDGDFLDGDGDFNEYPAEAARYQTTPAWDEEKTPASTNYKNITEAPRVINSDMFGKADACKTDEHKVEMGFFTDQFSEADNEVYLVQKPNTKIWNYVRGSFKTFNSTEDENSDSPLSVDYYFATCVQKIHCYMFTFVDEHGDLDYDLDGDFFAELILAVDEEIVLDLLPNKELRYVDYMKSFKIIGKAPVSPTRPYKYQVQFGNCTQTADHHSSP